MNYCNHPSFITFSGFVSGMRQIWSDIPDIRIVCSSASETMRCNVAQSNAAEMGAEVFQRYFRLSMSDSAFSRQSKHKWNDVCCEFRIFIFYFHRMFIFLTKQKNPKSMHSKPYEKQLPNSILESTTTDQHSQEQPSSSKMDVLKRNAIHSCCAQVRWQRAQHWERARAATIRCVIRPVCMKSISKCKHGGSKRLVHRWNTKIYDCKRWQSDKSRISETFQTIPNQSEYKRWVFVAPRVPQYRLKRNVNFVVLIVHCEQRDDVSLLSKSFVCVFRLPVAHTFFAINDDLIFSNHTENDRMQMK